MRFQLLNVMRSIDHCSNGARRINRHQDKKSYKVVRTRYVTLMMAKLPLVVVHTSYMASAGASFANVQKVPILGRPGRV
jgi:hypothetical protein